MASVQSAQRRSRPGIRATIKQALSANTALDFTRIPVRRAMLLLAIPMMAEMMMESIFAVVDIFFVARIGPEAVAAVGLTEALMTLVVAVGMGLATATTAMIARRIGEGRPEAAGVVAGQALLIGLLASLAVGFVGLRYGSQLLGLMGADTAVVDVGGGYTTVMLAGSLSLVYLFLANAIFRGAGDAALAFRALWLANGINLVLDP
ncbi:MAG: MATE family efflux transporter, partial [Pseudomonadota bacterium]